MYRRYMAMGPDRDSITTEFLHIDPDRPVLDYIASPKDSAAQHKPRERTNPEGAKLAATSETESHNDTAQRTGHVPTSNRTPHATARVWPVRRQSASEGHGRTPPLTGRSPQRSADRV